MNRSIFNVFQSNKFFFGKISFAGLILLFDISLLTQCGNRENELVDFSLHWRRKKALNIYIYIYIFFFREN